MVQPAPVCFRVSVIVPTHNDAALIDKTLEAIARLPEAQVIIVDSGSTDDTVARVQRHGARVVMCGPDRGRQMRTGAAAANGDVLIFCPPGNILTDAAVSRMLWTLSDPEVVGGDFDFRFSGGRVASPILNLMHRALRVIGLRTHNLAWFIWRTACEGEAGFRNHPVFEDIAVLGRLHRKGKVTRVLEKISLVPRHEGHRLFWTILQIPHHMGVPARAFGRMYHSPNGDAEVMTAEAAEAQAIANPH